MIKFNAPTNKSRSLLIRAVFFGFLFLTCMPAMSFEMLKPKKMPIPKYFVGAGFGINDYGVGVCAELHYYKKFWIYGCEGQSVWGRRLCGGLSYYPKSNGFKSSFNLGYSYAYGVKNIEPELQVVRLFQGYQVKKVLMDLKPVRTVNLTYSYNLRIGLKSKIVFSGGYSRLLNDNFIFRTKNHDILSIQSQEYLYFWAPGGFIFGVRFLVGI